MTADFLIVGGGIAGISAAARLAHLGRVILLEAEAALGYHASGRSAALFEPRYGLPPVVALTHASAAHHRSVDGEGVLGPRGLLIVAGPEGADAFAEDLRQMELTAITPGEAQALVPILDIAAVAHAAHADHAWDIDTDRLIQSFLREARGLGARIETSARVTAIARIGRAAAGRPGGLWQVTTPAGVFEGRILVNAAGAWVDEVAGMAGLAPLGFTPCRRSIARIPAPAGLDPARWPMIFGAGETWYAKPDAGALIVSPADEDPMPPQDAWPDDMVLAEGLARYEAMVTATVTRMLARWAGLRTFAPDRVLVIGPDPREPAFVWLAGQGGYGFQTAPAASRLAADLIAGTPPELDAALLRALSPQRFLA